MLANGGFTWTAEAPADWRWPLSGAESTRYEAKALASGMKPIHLEFEKKRQ
jgi:tRNA (guanine-N7-)-methyltransferase